MLKKWLVFCVPMLGVALFIIVFGRTYASVPLHEIGDFAANSLLVQDARHLHLLVGHYSRVGFNHPGPALLYVLAAGESIFFDLLHWTVSPFSGQIYAVALLSGFWIVAIGTLLRRMHGSLAHAVITTALFVSVSAYLNFQAFAGPWFPHMDYFAFAAFTVAVAALIMGRADGLVLLAVSLGFLLNAHVAFVGVTAVMLVCAVAANTWLTRLGKTSNAQAGWLLSRAYLTRHWHMLAIAAAIVGLFLLPLAIQTVLHFPGPIADYAAFSHAHHANRPADAARFVGLFWSNGLFGLVFGAVACAVLVTNPVAQVCEDRVAPERALALALACATAGFLFYAVLGVDDLSLTYVGIFYYAVPALALTLLLKRVLDNVTAANPRVAAAVCVAACAFTAIRIHQVPENLAQYDDPQIPAAYATVNRLAGGTGMVLDLDNSTQWERLWPTLVGVENQARREGHVPFCIADNWQLLFTQAVRCTQEQIDAASGRFLVSAVPKEGMVSAANVAGLYFYPRETVK